MPCIEWLPELSLWSGGRVGGWVGELVRRFPPSKCSIGWVRSRIHLPTHLPTCCCFLLHVFDIFIEFAGPVLFAFEAFGEQRTL